MEIKSKKEIRLSVEDVENILLEHLAREHNIGGESSTCSTMLRRDSSSGEDRYFFDGFTVEVEESQPTGDKPCPKSRPAPATPMHEFFSKLGEILPGRDDFIELNVLPNRSGVIELIASMMGAPKK